MPHIDTYGKIREMLEAELQEAEQRRQHLANDRKKLEAEMECLNEAIGKAAYLVKVIRDLLDIVERESMDTQDVGSDVAKRAREIEAMLAAKTKNGIEY